MTKPETTTDPPVSPGSTRRLQKERESIQRIREQEAYDAQTDAKIVRLRELRLAKKATEDVQGVIVPEVRKHPALTKTGVARRKPRGPSAALDLED